MNRLTLLMAAILLIASCTKKSSPTATKVPAISKEEMAAAANLYSNNCSKCHGATGTEGKAPNLAQVVLSKAEIGETIKNGAGRMPAFATKLSEKEIASIATFVVSLKN